MCTAAGRWPGAPLRILRRVADKHADMLGTSLPSGLRVTAEFHAGLAAAYHPHSPAPTGGALPGALTLASMTMYSMRRNSSDGMHSAAQNSCCA